MRVTIWDMDFYYKKNPTPNSDLMKISSFHKQQGHLVNFVTEEFHIDLSYDVFYLFRDTRLTPAPPTKIADSPKTKVMGSTFKYYPNLYQIDDVIAAVRPDYLLYPAKEKDAYYNADVIQFFNNGRYIDKRQPITNLQQESRKTLVVDKNFWEHNEKDIERALIELQNYKNVAFMAPIRVKILIKNQKVQNLFLNLSFNQSTLFRFRNDFGSKATEAKKIIEFYARLKKLNPYVNMGFIPIKTVTSDH